ncbi:hypothetical protein KEM56_006934 [Ascosphaera pollenicola]|nr:hypothetical protein KEM56_006934 [Ascosphaera pollenicola]
MATTLAKNPYYIAYLKINKNKVNLPPWPKDDNELIDVLQGKVWCRVQDCLIPTPTSSTNNLRKHLQQSHTELRVLAHKGGKPSTATLIKATQIYKSLDTKATDENQDEEEDEEEKEQEKEEQEQELK